MILNKILSNMLITMKKILLSLAILGFITNLSANTVSALAQELNLYAGTKASVQWERIFSSDRRMKRYGLDTLDYNKLLKLKHYLIKHSADSKQPVVPGL